MYDNVSITSSTITCNINLENYKQLYALMKCSGVCLPVSKTVAVLEVVKLSVPLMVKVTWQVYMPLSLCIVSLELMKSDCTLSDVEFNYKIHSINYQYIATIYCQHI